MDESDFGQNVLHFMAPVLNPSICKDLTFNFAPNSSFLSTLINYLYNTISEAQIKKCQLLCCWKNYLILNYFFPDNESAIYFVTMCVNPANVKTFTNVWIGQTSCTVNGPPNNEELCQKKAVSKTPLLSVFILLCLTVDSIISPQLPQCTFCIIYSDSKLLI